MENQIANIQLLFNNNHDIHIIFHLDDGSYIMVTTNYTSKAVACNWRNNQEWSTNATESIRDSSTIYSSLNGILGSLRQLDRNNSLSVLRLKLLSTEVEELVLGIIQRCFNDSQSIIDNHIQSLPPQLAEFVFTILSLTDRLTSLSEDSLLETKLLVQTYLVDAFEQYQ